MQTKLEMYIEEEILLTTQKYAEEINKTVPEFVGDLLSTYINKKQKHDQWLDSLDPTVREMVGSFIIDEEKAVAEYYLAKENEQNDPTFIPIPDEEREELLKKANIDSSSPFLSEWAFRYKATRQIDWDKEIEKARWERFVERYLLRQ